MTTEITATAMHELAGILTSLIVYLLAFAMFLHYMNKADRLEREALERKLAYYDPKTKDFTWNNSKASPSKCKCTVVQKALGDGCSICNPQYLISMLQDQVNELEAQIEQMKEDNIIKEKQ